MRIDITSLLSSGDKRSAKDVDKVVRYIIEGGSGMDEVVSAVQSSDEVLAMHASDALQKIHIEQPGILNPYTEQLLVILATCSQKEVRWHMAQIVPSLPLTNEQLQLAARVWVDDYYHSSSSIVKTFSLQAMHDIAARNSDIRRDYEAMRMHALNNGTPAMKSRATKLHNEESEHSKKES